MPAKIDHETLACENLKTLEFLRSRIDDFPHWVTVVAFYAAVQIVEAVFAADGLHSDDHKSRNRTLKSTPRYAQLWKHYHPLWNDSLIARYMEDVAGGAHGPLFAEYMPGSDVEKTHLRHHLRQIIQSARRLLADERFLSDFEI
jgi:hypothetical protein